MEYNTGQVPNLAALDRCTGKGVFFPTGQAAGIDLGMILLHTLKYSPTRIDVEFPIDGNIVLASEETYMVKPVLEITGQEYATPILPLIFQGTANAAVVQALATAATFSFTAVLGGAFDIGARNITMQNDGATFVKVGATAKTENVDFYIERNKGIIRIPVVAGGIAAGDTVVVTFNKPALTRDSVTALNLLNQAGNLKFFKIDNKNPNVPKEEWTMPGNMTADDGATGDPKKIDNWKLRFAVVGTPTVIRRAS